MTTLLKLSGSAGLFVAFLYATSTAYLSLFGPVWHA